MNATDSDDDTYDVLGSRTETLAANVASSV